MVGLDQLAQPRHLHVYGAVEGAELAGYQSIIIGSVRDPIILRQFDSWLTGLVKAARDRITSRRSGNLSSSPSFLSIR